MTYTLRFFTKYAIFVICILLWTDVNADTDADANSNTTNPLTPKQRSIVESIIDNQVSKIDNYLKNINNIDFDILEGTTPLLLAVKYNNLEITNKIIESGANLNIKNESGVSPLILASNQGSLEVAKALLEAGANPNIEDKAGNSPLIHATVKNYDQIIVQLLKYGADIDIVDRENRNIFWYASRLDDKHIFNILVTHKEAQNTLQKVSENTADHSKLPSNLQDNSVKDNIKKNTQKDMQQNYQNNIQNNFDNAHDNGHIKSNVADNAHDNGHIKSNVADNAHNKINDINNNRTNSLVNSDTQNLPIENSNVSQENSLENNFENFNQDILFDEVSGEYLNRNVQEDFNSQNTVLDNIFSDKSDTHSTQKDTHNDFTLDNKPVLDEDHYVVDKDDHIDIYNQQKQNIHGRKNEHIDHLKTEVKKDSHTSNTPEVYNENTKPRDLNTVTTGDEYNKMDLKRLNVINQKNSTNKITPKQKDIQFEAFNINLQDIFKPESIRNMDNGTHTYDMHQNIVYRCNKNLFSKKYIINCDNKYNEASTENTRNIGHKKGKTNLGYNDEAKGANIQHLRPKSYHEHNQKDLEQMHQAKASKMAEEIIMPEKDTYNQTKDKKEQIGVQNNNMLHSGGTLSDKTLEMNYVNMQNDLDCPNGECNADTDKNTEQDTSKAKNFGEGFKDVLKKIGHGIKTILFFWMPDVDNTRTDLDTAVTNPNSLENEHKTESTNNLSQFDSPNMSKKTNIPMSSNDVLNDITHKNTCAPEDSPTIEAFYSEGYTDTILAGFGNKFNEVTLNDLIVYSGAKIDMTRKLVVFDNRDKKIVVSGYEEEIRKLCNDAFDFGLYCIGR